MKLTKARVGMELDRQKQEDAFAKLEALFKDEKATAIMTRKTLEETEQILRSQFAKEVEKRWVFILVSLRCSAPHRLSSHRFLLLFAVIVLQEASRGRAQREGESTGPAAGEPHHPPD